MITESFSRKIEFPSDFIAGNDANGYQFWTWQDNLLGKNIKMVAAMGNGGQNIYWDMKNELIVVVTSGNYNRWDIKNDPQAIVRNHIYPSLSIIE